MSNTKTVKKITVEDITHEMFCKWGRAKYIESGEAKAAKIKNGYLWLLNSGCPNTGYKEGWRKTMYSHEILKQFMVAELNGEM